MLLMSLALAESGFISIEDYGGLSTEDSWKIELYAQAIHSEGCPIDEERVLRFEVTPERVIVREGGDACLNAAVAKAAKPPPLGTYALRFGPYVYPDHPGDAELIDLEAPGDPATIVSFIAAAGAEPDDSPSAGNSDALAEAFALPEPEEPAAPPALRIVEGRQDLLLGDEPAKRCRDTLGDDQLHRVVLDFTAGVASVRQVTPETAFGECLKTELGGIQVGDWTGTVTVEVGG